MLDMSIFTEREDLQAVIDAIYNLPSTDQKHLFLFGESQGGCVAGITAPRNAEKLQAMILYYPAFCIPEDARKRFRSAEEIRDKNDIFGMTVGRTYYENLLSYDVYDAIQGFGKPVLILHGDNDRTVDPSYGRKASEIYTDADFVLLQGEPHGFTAKGKEIAIHKVYQFLEEQL